MSAMRKITVELPEEAIRAIEADVAAGLYKSESEAVASAILGEQNDAPSPEFADDVLMAKVREALDDPRPTLSYEELVRETDDYMTRRLRELGIEP